MFSRLTPAALAMGGSFRTISFAEKFHFTSDPTTVLNTLKPSESSSDYQLLFFTPPDLRGYTERVIPILEFCEWVKTLESEVDVDVSIIPNTSSLRHIPQTLQFKDPFVLMIHRNGRLVKVFQDRWFSQEMRAFLSDPEMLSDSETPESIEARYREAKYNTIARDSLFPGDPDQDEGSAPLSFPEFPESHPRFPSYFLKPKDKIPSIYTVDDSDTEIPWLAHKHPKAFENYSDLREQTDQLLDDDETALDHTFFNQFSTPSASLTPTQRTAEYLKFAFRHNNPVSIKTPEAESEDANEGAEAKSESKQEENGKTSQSADSPNSVETSLKVNVKPSYKDHPLLSYLLESHLSPELYQERLHDIHTSGLGTGTYTDYMDILKYIKTTKGLVSDMPDLVHKIENYVHLEPITKLLQEGELISPKSTSSPYDISDMFFYENEEYLELYEDGGLDYGEDTIPSDMKVIPILNESHLSFDTQ